MEQSPTFLYGASTSAHQVEGNNVHNDWWAWEQSTSGVVRSGNAVGHYARYKEDFALAQELGHNAHRLSIEWSRIEPTAGVWNRKAVEHYRDVLEDLRSRGMTVFVTLHHFTNPVWFAERGGWENEEASELFARYVTFIAQQFNGLVDFWVTINEPMVYVLQSYWFAKWPPQKKSFFGMLRVIRNMARGHKLAYRAIHLVDADAQVGIAKHLVAYLPEHKKQWDDKFIVALEDWWFNRRFFSLTSGYHDYIGVNYYFTRKKRVHVFPPSVSNIPWEGDRSDIGWPIRPEGLTHVLLKMKKHNLPVYVTENGLADSKDAHRSEFIRSHLRAVEKAQAQGVDVRGYMHWSLLDNFEWVDGFEPRFGLIGVDLKTMERTVRPSAYVYKAIIEQVR